VKTVFKLIILPPQHPRAPCSNQDLSLPSPKQDNFEAGIPESFNVLVKEVRGLGLNMELLDAVEEE
jgi:DNA-directed RNA polymerase beta subunit